MSIVQNQVQFIGGTQIIINALGASSFPFKFQTGPNSTGGQIALVSGATTFIIPNQVSGATIAGATSLTGLVGWPVTTTPSWCWEGPANFYIATGSATTIISAVIYYNSGGTLV